MMAPKYERISALYAAATVVAHAHDEPIRRIDIHRETIVIFAGVTRFTLAYDYQNAFSPDGSAMPGSGNWSAHIIEKRVTAAGGASTLRRALAALFGGRRDTP